MDEIVRSDVERRVTDSPTRSNDTEFFHFWNPQYLNPKTETYERERRFNDDRRGCEHDGNTDVEWNPQRNEDGTLDGDEICEDCDSRWPIKVDEDNGRID